MNKNILGSLQNYPRFQKRCVFLKTSEINKVFRLNDAFIKIIYINKNNKIFFQFYKFQVYFLRCKYFFSP